MKPIKLKAPAKTNLTLEVLRKLPSGFHEIRTIMTKLPDLYDEISIKFDINEKAIILKSNAKNMPIDETNICFKTAKAFFEKTKKSGGIEIYVKKNIPIGAGLGGGSSDGAVVLKILNKHFHYPLSQKQLINLSSRIGKDIPFFFSEKNSALIEGAGEKINKTFTIPKLNILLINPGIHISTKWAYENLSPLLGKIKRQAWLSQKIMLAAKNKDIKLISKYLYNDFEILVEKEYPLIKKLKNELLENDASGSLMSGSGSTVFGIFKSKKILLTAKKNLIKKYPKFMIK